MDNQDTIKSIAFRYFEGNISPDDELQLLDYIKSSKDNSATFRRWEDEWKDSAVMSERTQQSWNEFKHKIEIKGFVEPKAKTRKISLLWINIASAAAVIAILFGMGLWKMSSSSISYFTCNAPEGSKAEVRLPDGSKVILNSGSELQYPSNFGYDNRNVKLEGEAYFEVAKHNGKHFTVHTSGYDVTVKGTKFNVSAYDEDNFISTTLIEGKVEISMDNKTVDMKPGEKITLDKSTKQLSKMTIDADRSTNVKDRLAYDDITLSQFARILSRQYGVRVHINNYQSRNMSISVLLQNGETIDEVVSALRHITQCNIQIKGKDIYIN